MAARELCPMANTWVPSHTSDIFRFQVDYVWSIDDEGGVGPVVEDIAANLIPRVPCLCGIHGASIFEPATTHRFVTNGDQHLQADLDETTSIKEFTPTFRGALHAEHNECMRLYGEYSRYNCTLLPFQFRDTLDLKKAIIPFEGICDALPSLNIGDRVLLRPYLPVWASWRDQWCTVEIQTRIFDVVPGKGGVPDQIVISWLEQRGLRIVLNDPRWARQYAIRFVPQSTPLERCLTSLDWLDGLSSLQQPALEVILFPVAAPKVKALTAQQRRITQGPPVASNNSPQTDIGDIDKPLNEQQSTFVRMVRARTLDASFDMSRPPMILTGPAGTGKTKTLIYAIADVLKLGPLSQPNANRVLVCCPSHAACDVVTRRLSRLLNRTEMFRLFDHSRPISAVTSDVLQFTRQVPGSHKFTLPGPREWMAFRVVVCTCMDAHLLFRSQLTNSAVRAKRECFRHFLSSSRSALGVCEVSWDATPLFTHLFVDEAAQATEPEILIPISCVVDPHLGGGRKVEIVLSGDPRQLSPQVYADNASDSLGRSLVERLLRRPVACVGGGEASLLGPEAVEDPNSLSALIKYYAQSEDGQEVLTVFLTENYRCSHPSFLMMPSSLHYYDRLRSAKMQDEHTPLLWCDMLRKIEALSMPVDAPTISTGAAPRGELSEMFSMRQTNWPIHFRGVRGQDVTVDIKHFVGSNSWQNNEEAHAIVEIIHTLVVNGVEAKRIGAMSPFRGQVTKIRKLLRERGHHSVNVGIVENFQGVQREVIVLSLTRSNPDFVKRDVKNGGGVGIFGRPKRANVAMTRAKSLFIVVGNPDAMWTDSYWKHWLRFCLRNGLWFGEGLAQWKNADSISYNGMKVVPTIDLDNDNGNNYLVMSTLERMERALVVDGAANNVA